MPIIGNGDVHDEHSAEAILRAAGRGSCQLSGLMLARGALKDCRVFSRLARAKARFWGDWGGGRRYQEEARGVGGCVEGGEVSKELEQGGGPPGSCEDPHVGSGLLMGAGDSCVDAACGDEDRSMFTPSTANDEGSGDIRSVIRRYAELRYACQKSPGDHKRATWYSKETHQKRPTNTCAPQPRDPHASQKHQVRDTEHAA